MLNIETIMGVLRRGEYLTLSAQHYTYNEIELMYKLVSQPGQLTLQFSGHVFSEDELTALIRSAPIDKATLDFSID